MQKITLDANDPTSLEEIFRRVREEQISVHIEPPKVDDFDIEGWIRQTEDAAATDRDAPSELPQPEARSTSSPEVQPPTPRGRPFQPGNRGRPIGARNRRTALAEAMMQRDFQDVVDAVTEAAKDGDMTAARLVLDRLAPAPRGRRVRFTLPPIATAAELNGAMEHLLDQTAKGRMTLEEARQVAGLLDARRKAIETHDLAARVARLEAKSS